MAADTAAEQEATRAAAAISKRVDGLFIVFT